MKQMLAFIATLKKNFQDYSNDEYLSRGNTKGHVSEDLNMWSHRVFKANMFNLNITINMW